mgnify:CR=1 FL=1
MSTYTDGFVHSIAKDQLDDYRTLVEAVAEIWIDHGALDYRESVGDDLHLEGTRSFADLVSAESHEAVLFGWVLFESREARDLVNEKVAADPRMAELMANADVGFDAARMAFGGFRQFVSTSGEDP